MLNHKWYYAGLATAVMLAIGCGEDASVDAGTSPDSGIRDAALPDAARRDAGHDAGAPPVGFDPSNVGNRAHLQAYPPNPGCSNATFDTDMGTSSSCNCSFELIPSTAPSPADMAAVFYCGALDLNRVGIVGSRPAIIIALGPIVIRGEMQVENGLQVEREARANQVGIGEGAGGGPISAGTTDPGAGGGGFCSRGGEGSSAPSVGGAASGGISGRAYGDPSLAPLRLGSTGGSSRRGGIPGRAGGALQLVSSAEIHVTSSARIWLGQRRSTRYAGGSSGGSLLLEAPVVRIDGSINNYGSDAEIGGIGSVDGLTGVSGSPGVNEAGGGGSGYIRINTATGGAEVALDALLQPPASSPCLSEGLLAPRTEPTPDPACEAVSSMPNDCEVCVGETCCAELTVCRGEGLCELCVDTPRAERGPGCSGDTAFQDVLSCATTTCPSHCASF